jgi:hypothetical protein
MRLQGIEPGDIVLISDLHAVVIRKQPRELVVQGICSKSLRHVKAAEVAKHWRLARSSNG